MAGERIYVVEDEADIAELIRYNLAVDGYDVQCFESGEKGLQSVDFQRPDLVILDLMLPGRSGLEICKHLKEKDETKKMPIIMVTAKGEEQDIVRGLEMGADDYVTKPFSPKVLAARVKAALRRQQEEPKEKDSETLVRGELEIHLGRHEVKISGEKVELTFSEFEILQFLARRPGWVYTRAQIVQAIRGDNYSVTDRTIDFQMVGLRKKLGSQGDQIETVRGVGYRFKE